MEELWQSNRNIYIYIYNVFSHDEYIYIFVKRMLFEKLLKLLKLINC